MRFAILPILLGLLLITACAHTATQNQTNDTTQTGTDTGTSGGTDTGNTGTGTGANTGGGLIVRNATLLDYRVEGGFQANRVYARVLHVNVAGEVTYQTLQPDGTVTDEKTGQLTDQQMADLQERIGNIGQLNATYGQQWKGQVADVPALTVIFRRGNHEERVIIDPNLGEAQPESLKPVIAWAEDEILSLQGIGRCDPNNRPEVCTKQYDPVCGNDGKTYGNSCEACSDSNVFDYQQGACTQNNTDGTDTRLAFVQCSDPRPQSCAQEYKPVCGEVDNGIRCIQAPCPSTDQKDYSNGCEACADPKVTGYWPGTTCANIGNDVSS